MRHRRQREFKPLALKASRSNEATREEERHLAVLAEPHGLVCEVSFRIRAAITRALDLEEKLKPRIGASQSEHLDRDEEDRAGHAADRRAAGGAAEVGPRAGRVATRAPGFLVGEARGRRSTRAAVESPCARCVGGW